MAVIEISKIQVRRGQEGVSGMPQLDSGELGWAIDTQSLYIGNGSVAEGAPAVGNTEILTTQNISNFFNINARYVYGDSYYTNVLSVIDVPVETGDIARSVVAKLDDFVNVLDFGATGRGVVDDGPAIQQAINQLYLNSNDKLSPNSRKPLRFPAGTYKIGGTIFVPPYATLVGDGIDKTIFVINANVNMIKFCDGTSVPGGTPPNSNAGGYVLFSNGVNNITSRHPQNIYIDGITFKYENASPVGFNTQQPLISADCVSDSVILNCKFQGQYSASGAGTIANSNLDSTTDMYTGIEFRSQGIGNTIVSNNVLIKDCIFTGLKYGMKSYYDGYNIIISNNKFFILNRGILWNPNPTLLATAGMRQSKIVGNNFDTIFNEAIYVGKNNGDRTDHVSNNNSFSNVGNGLNSSLGDDARPVNAVIKFTPPGNVTYGDVFSRDTYITNNTPRSYLPTVSGHALINSNIAFTSTIATSAVLISIPFTGNDQSINVDYLYSAMYSGVDVSRKGTLSIEVSANLSSASITDNFAYLFTDGASDPEPHNGLTFTAELITEPNYVPTNYINVSYTGGYTEGLIEYKFNYLS
jgi:hypothetical protein